LGVDITIRKARHPNRGGRDENKSVKSQSFFAELKRRNVYKVAVAYA